MSNGLPNTAIVPRDGAGETGVRGMLHRWTKRLAGPAYEDKIDKLKIRANEYGVDPFGLDLEFAKAAIAPVLWLYKHYFRVETHGIANVPAGRVLLIANHSGQLPFDAAMIGCACLIEATPPRIARAMFEKWVPTLPWFSSLFPKLGQVVGTPENCRRLLKQDETVMVFPEGVRGISKLYAQRYQLQEFGLGFMRLALETDTPIVPVAVIGAEEQAPAIADLKGVGRLFGMPSLPVVLQGVPLPLPAKYRIHFGPPMRFSGAHDEEDAEVEKKVRQVKDTIQAMLQAGLRDRRAIFW